MDRHDFGDRPPVGAERVAEYRRIVRAAEQWASDEPAIIAVAVVGSWARDGAHADSDIDFVILTTDRSLYLDDSSWQPPFACSAMTDLGQRDWVALIERRFRTTSGVELDVGFVEPSWAEVDPVDEGTRRVVTEGFHVLYDPEGVLTRLQRNARRNGSD